MNDTRQRPGFFGVMLSVLAAFFGVQSNAKRQRDFEQGRPIHFILMGLVLTIIFLLLVWGLVELVLYVAGA
jgi:hypothetical protein